MRTIRGIIRKDFIPILIVILLGLTIRVIVAPYSTGSDIPQFAGFADTFLRHGVCFYLYADGHSWEEENWPYNWPYVYGPIWIYILGVLRIIAPTPVEHYWSDGVYHVYAPMDWIVAVKAVIIFFDTIAALLLYIIVKKISGDNVVGVLTIILYYLNPMAIYISGIYGMFDPIALAFMLLAILLYKEKPLLGGLFLGLSILAKHTMLFPSIIFVLYIVLYKKELLKKILEGALVSIVITLAPFIIGCPQSIPVFIKVTFFSSKPGYTYPIVYSFNGLSSLATYIHDKCGYDTLWMIKYWYIPATILLLMIVAYMMKSRELLLPLSLAYIVFTATYWRVNHQYLVPTIAFLLLVAAKTRKLSTRITALLTIVLIGIWPIAFPTSWWFHAHIKQPNQTLWNLVDTMTLMIFCEVFYVVYSITLTELQYLTIIVETWDKTLEKLQELIDKIKQKRIFLLYKG
ncbi:hypothetical protein J4526_08250 [Desulfurococcaceae archaeon MEX13E-LK6-19]|nr:hypothetical protein J4526_08250 [Desulfurococcaceae archaeon MEX13E-LK6-19]